MEARMRRSALIFSWTGCAVLLSALAAANLLAYQLFLRADFSANGAYSISPGTKALLRGLQDTLTVKVYYTTRLPPPYGLDRQYLKDLLSEYKSASRGRLRFEMLDPDQEKRRNEALAAGIAPLQLSVMGRDKFEVKQSFMGMVFLYKGKTEVMPVINGTADLEYDISRRIKKLTSAKVRTIGFVTGHGEVAPDDSAYAQVFAQIREQLDTQTVSLAKPVPAGVDALWIWAPTARFQPAELERLKAWLGMGKTLGLLLSRREVDFRSFRARPQDPGLEPLLAQCGLELSDGFVADAQSEKIQMESAYGMFRAVSVVDYPFIPLVTDLDREHPAVRGLDAVSFPFAHAVRTTAVRPGLAYTSLAYSSPHSWLRSDESVAPGRSLEELSNRDVGPFSLAGVLSGDFSKVIPTTWTATDAPAAAAHGPGNLIIVGTGKLAQPQFIGKQANLALVMNLLEWSLQDESLLTIRSKGKTYRPLRPLPGLAALLIKYAMIFFLPLALLAAGFGLNARRKRERRRLAQNFDEA
ncbi:MAG: GldG family protein [Elusimicrobiota bacterium]|jgi:ABC-type uncharacterized transport system involved in gliding motility auxiliary subunit